MRIYKYETYRDKSTLRPYAVKERAVNYTAQKRMDNPDKIARMLRDVFRHDELTEERMYMLAFNAKSDLLGVFEISRGTAVQSVVSPREVFQKALMVGAVFIIVAHNHPSGDIMPSEADVLVTRRLKQAGDLLDVRLLDSIILSSAGYYSFNEEGMMQNKEVSSAKSRTQKKYVVRYIDGHDLRLKSFETFAEDQEEAVKKLKEAYPNGDFDHRIGSITEDNSQ